MIKNRLAGLSHERILFSNCILHRIKNRQTIRPKNIKKRARQIDKFIKIPLEVTFQKRIDARNDISFAALDSVVQN